MSKKELKQQIDALQARILDLEQRIAELEARPGITYSWDVGDGTLIKETQPYGDWQINRTPYAPQGWPFGKTTSGGTW